LPDGSFVVTDGYAGALFSVSTSGGVTPFVQGPPLVNPQGIARLADGTLLVVDPQAGAIFRIHPDGAIDRWVTVGS
jgi:glucose/arabinose dehydrogenase